MRAVENVASVRNHWWWRPGWREGRHFYACHFTFEDHPEVRELAATYQEPLSRFGQLDLIPAEWLHLTMQGIGFVDEVSDDEIWSVTERVGDYLSRVSVPSATFDRSKVQPEAILIPALPFTGVDEVRRVVHKAISEVLGLSRTPDSDLNHALQGYRPHVSIAYVNEDGPADHYVQALREVEHAPVKVLLRSVSILRFHRDNRMYEWTESVPIPIGRA